MIWIFVSVVALIVWIFFAIAGLAQIDALPKGIGKHFDEPEERLAWGIRLAAALVLGAGLWDLLIYDGQLPWHDFSVELVMAAVTVLILDELNQLRSRAEYKKQIIQQLASHSNEFALDAVRIVTDNEWLRDGSLQEVRLMEANLSRAKLSEANLSKADLRKANLEGTNLRRVRLEGAHLCMTKFVGADLREADLSKANLIGAKLKGANLLKANLNGATYHPKNQWPDGFDPQVAGAILVEDTE